MATEPWFAFALATAALWGAGTFASKPATDRLGIRRMLGLVAVGEGALYVILFFGIREPVAVDGRILAFGFLAGISGILGYIFYYEGIQTGTVGLLGTVTAAYPAPTILLSLAFLGETLRGEQGVGIVLVLACVALLSFEPRASRRNPTRAVVMALFAFVAWGLWGYFAKVAVDGLGEGNLFGIYAMSNAVVIAGYLLLTRRRVNPVPRKPRAWPLGLATMALGASGVIALTLAYARGPASLVTSVTGSYPVVSSIAAALALGERFGWREAFALALFVLGIFLIAI
jgi:drug/metabolite transporter (DMT)-like permease